MASYPIQLTITLQEKQLKNRKQGRVIKICWGGGGQGFKQEKNLLQIFNNIASKTSKF